MAMPGKHFLIETEGSSEDDGKGNADADIILQESRLKMRTINNYLDKDYSLKYLLFYYYILKYLFIYLFIRCWWEDEKSCAGSRCR